MSSEQRGANSFIQTDKVSTSQSMYYVSAVSQVTSNHYDHSVLNPNLYFENNLTSWNPIQVDTLWDEVMKWSGSSGFWIKQRWLKTLHQSWTIKGQTRFKSLPHHFPEHSSLLARLSFISVQNIIFLHSHNLFFCSVSKRIFLAHASATKTDCFPSMAVITMSWLRQRLYLPIAMCQAARLEERFLWN